MQRRFRSAQNGLTQLSQVDLTPLIDLAFSLLLIFMITAPLLEQSLPIALPVTSAHAAQTASNTPVQVIGIDQNGQCYWGKQPVSLKTLEEHLAQLAESADQPAQLAPILHIRAAGQGLYQHVVDVLSLAQRYQLTRVHLDTEVGV